MKVGEGAMVASVEADRAGEGARPAAHCQCGLPGFHVFDAKTEAAI